MGILDEQLTLADVEPYTPEKPTVPTAPPVSAVYQAPEATVIPQVTPGAYMAPEVYVPGKEATVEGRLSGLLSSGSPYLEAARQSAKRTAQARGLLNTTMAASAGEKAAIESALPIAQQDASASYGAEMAGYQGKLTAAQSVLGHEQAQSLVGTQATATSALQTQGARETAALETMKADIASGLSMQEAIQKAYQTSYEAALTAGLSRQAAQQKAASDAQNAQYAYELQAEQNRANKVLEAMKQAGANLRTAMEGEIAASGLTSTEKQEALAKLAALGQNYSDQVVSIRRDPNIPPEEKTKILAGLQQTYNNNTGMVAALTGVKVDWPLPAEPPPPPDTGAPPPDTGAPPPEIPPWEEIGVNI